MQVLCDLRPTFLKCNCQTPGENGYSGESDDGEAGHYGRIESS